MKVFLDDIRNAPDDTWTVVRTAQGCIDLLMGRTVTELSLDHDLGTYVGNTEITGYNVLLWLEQVAYEMPDFPLPEKVFVHSANPIGKRRMEDAIRRIFARRQA